MKFLYSQLLFLSGGYIQNVALSMLITKQTEMKNALGFFLFASYLPVFLFSFPASKLVCRLSPKCVLLVTDGILFGFSVFIAVFPVLPFWAYLVFGALWGTVRALQTPFAAATPRLICKKEHIQSGTFLINLALCLSRGAGPLLSGVITQFFGFSAAFFVNAFCFVPSFFLILKTDIPKKVSENVEGALQKTDKKLYIAVFIVALFGTSYNVILNGVRESLELSRLWFSLFMGTLGVGAAAGAFAGRQKGAFAGAGMGISLALAAFVKNRFFAAIVFLIVGFFDYLFFSEALCRINEQNDKASIGKAMGIYNTCTTGALPLAFLLMNIAQSAIGTAIPLIASGTVICAVSIFLFGKIR